MNVGEYQKCRTEASNIRKKNKDNPKAPLEPLHSFPFNPDIELVNDARIHEFFDKCDCVTRRNADEKAEETKYGSGEYVSWTQMRSLGEAVVASAEDRTVFDETTFKPHTAYCKIPRYEEHTDPLTDKTWTYFWLKNDETLESKHIIDRMHIETTYVNPKKDEKPLSTGKKGEAQIPFYYPRLQTERCAPGRIQYSFTISKGPLPEMIILTGMPHSRRKCPSYERCRTKTTMTEPGYVIKEFEIFVDNKYEFGTPWKTPRDHYINFLKHNGRYENKSFGEGVDFFQFRDENWFVPMSFADRAGDNALVEVRITFEEPLSNIKKACTEGEKPTEQSCDAFFMRLPVDSLILDSNRRSMLRVIYI